MIDTAAQKQELRRHLREARRRVAPKVRAASARRALAHLLRVPAVRQARRLALHWSVGSEFDTRPLLAALQSRGKRIYLPRLTRNGEKTLRFVRWHPGATVRRNRHGIPEPWNSCRIGLKKLDAVILPLLGFDASGYRLGTGGGYYDRTLAPVATSRRPRCIGWAYAMQICADLPHDPWDLRLHAVCTERGVLHFPTMPEPAP